MESGQNYLISVIVPCFNSEKHISEMINCLLGQTYKYFEAIFVDDGSTDNTTKIIDKYSSDSRIKTIEQKNRYAGVARNNGLAHAKGDYVIFLDSDDLFAPNMLEVLLKKAMSTGADVVISNIDYIDEKTSEPVNKDMFIKKSLLGEFEDRGVFSYKDIPNDIFAVGFSGPINKLCKMTFLKENNILFQDSKRDNDMSYSYSVMAAANRISWVYDSLYTYRINNANSLQGFGDRKIDIEDLLSTVTHSKSELIRLGKYEIVKYSFIKQILSRWHHLLENQQNNFYNYKVVYECIKNRLVYILELNIKDEYCFLAYRRDYKKIFQLSAEEYLFWKYRVSKIFGNETYFFDSGSIPKSYKKIVIYGYGLIGQTFVKQIEKYSDLQVVGILDKQFEMKSNLDSRVVSPENIDNYEYDAIVIAIEDVIISKAVIEWLIERDIPKERIIWNV